MTSTEYRVAGRCPVCGGESLFLGKGGHVTCGRLECRRPTAVDELINDLGPEHVVRLTETEFSVEHPVLERLEHTILDCELHDWLRAQPSAPMPPGWYKVAWPEDRWEPIAEAFSGVTP